MKRNSPVTIRDIATSLGISHATVSRALGDHPKINTDTKAKVRAAAAQLGYVPNASARAIRNAHSQLVGLVIPDIQNDFYASVAKRVADALAEQGYQLALAVTEDVPDREMRDVRGLLEARAAAVIVTLTATPRPETLTLLRQVHTVQLVRQHADLAGDAVAIDDAQGTRAGTEHLIQCGHRSIAYIGSTAALSSGRHRVQGFREAMEAAGLDASMAWLGPPRPEFARQALSQLLRSPQRPTGLVLGSSELTLGSLQGLGAAGVQFPQDMSVVGYGDPSWFSLVGQGITTVALPTAEVADMVVSLVMAGADADGAPAGSAPLASGATVLTMRPSLVLRGSTRMLAAPAAPVASARRRAR